MATVRVSARGAWQLPALDRRQWLWVVGGWLVGMRAPQAVGLQRERMLRAMEAQFGRFGLQALQRWLALLDAQTGASLPQQLKAVNAFWNTEILAGDDRVIWANADYWATPLQTLGKGTGDCEDYVIGKYFSLAYLGVPQADMRLIYVRASLSRGGQKVSVPHMVLGHYATPQAEPLVLDNLIDRIELAGRRTDLSPVFSFNTQGVFVPGSTTVGPVDRINRWQDLLARMQNEGFTL